MEHGTVQLEHGTWTQTFEIPWEEKPWDKMREMQLWYGYGTNLKVTCHLSLPRFTLKVHSQSSLSRFLAILKVPSFQTQLTYSQGSLSRFTLKVLGSWQYWRFQAFRLSWHVHIWCYWSAKTLLFSKWPFPIPYTHAHPKHFFLSAQQMRVLTAFVAANSLPGIELTSKLLLPVLFLPLPAPRSDSLFWLILLFRFLLTLLFLLLLVLLCLPVFWAAVFIWLIRLCVSIPCGSCQSLHELGVVVLDRFLIAPNFFLFLFHSTSCFADRSMYGFLTASLVQCLRTGVLEVCLHDDGRPPGWRIHVARHCKWWWHWVEARQRMPGHGHRRRKHMGSHVRVHRWMQWRGRRWEWHLGMYWWMPCLTWGMCWWMRRGMHRWWWWLLHPDVGLWGPRFLLLVVVFLLFVFQICMPFILSRKVAPISPRISHISF